MMMFQQKSIFIFITVLGIWVIRVANLYDHFLTVVGYWGLWWCFNKIYCHLHHCAWYMGHTNKWQICTTIFDSFRLLRIMMIFKKKSIVIFITNVASIFDSFVVCLLWCFDKLFCHFHQWYLYMDWWLTSNNHADIDNSTYLQLW